MKTSHDPRHKKRIAAIKMLFAWDFHKDNFSGNDLAKKVVDKVEILDAEVKKAAPTWPVDKINRIDLAILRLAIFELIIVKDAPYRVIVDEAIELAKEFGSDSSAGFVNGVLGKIISSHGLDKEAEITK